jgi:excisionase family DNA binding protein
MNKTSFEISRDWLSILEVSKIIGVREPTVRKLVKTGKLTGYRIGAKLIRIKRTDLNDFINSLEIV